MDRKIADSTSGITWNELLALNQCGIAAFQLKLADDKEPFICEQSVRIIPGKRLVVFGTWHRKPAVAKIFFEKNKAKEHAARDLQGVEILRQSSVPTPALYYRGTAVDKRIHVLLFEKIPQASSFYEIWENRKHVDHLSQLLHALTLELATQHVLGISQKDLHLKNFLVSGEKIFTLDGADIEKIDHPLDKETSLFNFALLISQLGIEGNHYCDDLFHTYAQSRGWRPQPSDYQFLKDAIIKCRKKRWDHYQKKIFRDCSAFVKIKNGFKSIMYDRGYGSEAFLNFLKFPETVFLNKDVQLLKNGNTSTVIKCGMSGYPMVVKRYNIKNNWHFLRRCFRPTRAATSWRLSQYLCLMGIPTAKPIAFIEKRFLGLRMQSYFVMQYIAGVHLGDYFAKANVNQEQIQLVAKKVVKMLNDLADLRLIHGDLKMTNIIIHEDEPLLIDLDGMREYRCPFGFKQAFDKEIKRFMANWESRPTVHKLFEGLL